MSRALNHFHHAALAYLADGYCTATHHVARACGFDKINGDRATARARNILKTLEGRGLVEGVRASRSGNVYWWRITDAGREAVQS